MRHPEQTIQNDLLFLHLLCLLLLLSSQQCGYRPRGSSGKHPHWRDEESLWDKFLWGDPHDQGSDAWYEEKERRTHHCGQQCDGTARWANGGVAAWVKGEEAWLGALNGTWRNDGPVSFSLMYAWGELKKDCCLVEVSTKQWARRTDLLNWSRCLKLECKHFLFLQVWCLMTCTRLPSLLWRASVRVWLCSSWSLMSRECHRCYFPH